MTPNRNFTQITGLVRPAITPGKWVAYAPGSATDSSEYWEIEDGFGHTATVYGDNAEAEANAKSTSNVPELFEMLEYILCAVSVPPEERHKYTDNEEFDLWMIGVEQQMLQLGYARAEPTATQETIAADSAQEKIMHGFGHPFTNAKGWDLLELKADSEAQLNEAVANAERKFWHVWVRDKTDRHGAIRCRKDKMEAVMYKPTNASGEWEDKYDEIHDARLESVVLSYGCPQPILDELLNRIFDEGYGCGSNTISH